MRRIAAILAVALAMGLSIPARAAADNDRFVLLVSGASGDPAYATTFRRWVDALTTMLHDRFQYAADHVVVLTETPKAGESKATADGVRQAIAALKPRLTATDQLVVILIGHGSDDASGAKFNLVGPDLTVKDWSELLASVPGHLAVVDTTSASFPFLAGLSGHDRVIITATNSVAQRYATVFPDAFIQALSSDAADLDKNGRVSLLEAFTTASRTVAQHYEQGGIMATEIALLDDNGDGKGTIAGTENAADGNVAAVTYLQGAAAQTSTDPETQRLLTRQRELTDQIDALRRRRGEMAADEYNRTLEGLLTELATVSHDVRQRQGQ
ncbi:MAG TPA: hypothetical protein VG538_02445 [Vicinamibacterales bacterium]|jgi:hypothetical protein|nr:hypothetical protein [Vicinamibacterales bacterium]